MTAIEDDVPAEVPETCRDAFQAMMKAANSESNSMANSLGKWIRGPVPHRMTENRRKRAAEALTRGAAKCRTLEAHFIQQHQKITSLPVPPTPAPIHVIRSTKQDLILSAVRDIKKRINSKTDKLVGQNLLRHQAVLGFLHLQLKNPEKIRIRVSQLAASVLGKGSATARCIRQ